MRKLSGLFSLKTKIIALAVVVVSGLAIIFIMGVVSLIAGSSNAQQEHLSALGLSLDVEGYRSTIQLQAEAQGIEQYVNHLLCIMQEETAGQGTDPMNAGAFACNEQTEKKRGSITIPNYSCLCGVTEFGELIKLAGVTGIDDTENLKIVYQAYHTDRGYIQYAKDRGGYSPENARTYIVENGYPDYTSAEFAENVDYWYRLITQGIGSFIYPLQSREISSSFGYRYGDFEGFHGGIDFPAPQGTEVHASADGKVILASQASTYGLCVKILHSSGYSTLYAHNSKLLVSAGQNVKQGDVIALVGSTGQSSGPHCHFEIRLNNQRVDPMPYLTGAIDVNLKSDGDVSQ